MPQTSDADDWSRVSAWLRSAGVEHEGPLAGGLLYGGRSNLTYRIEDATGRRFVLRRPPLYDVLETAHDVGREFRIMSALRPHGIPVAHPRAYCADRAVLGAPFYVMDFVDGTVLAGDEEGRAWPADTRGAAARNLVEVLARIHDIDVDGVGLGALGRRENYIARQLSRWHRQYSASSTRDIPRMQQLYESLVAAVPPQLSTTLVHGDYRFGNVMLAADGGVLAVLDWELAALGDPLADLGWLLATWRQPGEAEVFESPTGHEGYLSRAQLVELYEALSGRTVANLDFYVCFALWRLACISEGIFARYRSGAMAEADDGARYGDLVYDLSATALELLAAS